MTQPSTAMPTAEPAIRRARGELPARQADFAAHGYDGRDLAGEDFP